MKVRILLTTVALGSALFFPSALPLAAQQANGYLKVKTTTGRAGVFVDGKYVGPSANFRFTRKYAVPAGDHEISLQDPRYQEYTTKVTITAGKTTVVNHPLESAPLAQPPFGELRTEGGPDKFAGVFLNGKFMGHVDEFSNFAQRLVLPPGEYTVKIVSPTAGQEDEEKITIQADKTTTIKLKSSS